MKLKNKLLLIILISLITIFSLIGSSYCATVIEHNDKYLTIPDNLANLSNYIIAYGSINDMYFFLYSDSDITVDISTYLLDFNSSSTIKGYNYDFETNTWIDSTIYRK